MFSLIMHKDFKPFHKMAFILLSVFPLKKTVLSVEKKWLKERLQIEHHLTYMSKSICLISAIYCLWCPSQYQGFHLIVRKLMHELVSSFACSVHKIFACSMVACRPENTNFLDIFFCLCLEPRLTSFL